MVISQYNLSRLTKNFISKRSDLDNYTSQSFNKKIIQYSILMLVLKSDELSTIH